MNAQTKQALPIFLVAQMLMETGYPYHLMSAPISQALQRTTVAQTPIKTELLIRKTIAQILQEPPAPMVVQIRMAMA